VIAYAAYCLRCVYYGSELEYDKEVSDYRTLSSFYLLYVLPNHHAPWDSHIS
jgi:hypothetical protein